MIESGIGIKEEIICASLLVDHYNDVNAVANKVFEIKAKQDKPIDDVEQKKDDKTCPKPVNKFYYIRIIKPICTKTKGGNGRRKERR